MTCRLLLTRLAAGITLALMVLQYASAAEGTVAPADSLLPPESVCQSHPLVKQIESVIRRQADAAEFKPTALKREDYLKIVDGQVKVMRSYQNDAGRIIDPIRKIEFAFTTPCYAHAVATLAASGFDTDPALLASGRKAMEVAIADMVNGTCANKHGDFYTYPVMLAFEQFQKVLPADQLESWRKQLAAMNPAKTYSAYNAAHGNWGLVNTGGEFLRSLQGLTCEAYVDHMLESQRANFTPQGLYQENGNPFAYDAFSRYYLTGMLHRGYRGPEFEFYRDTIWKGAWTSLLIQSPFGELPTCYRSAHHIWNEAELAKICEVNAAHYAKAGRVAEAGAFKRGAHLALQSILGWIRPDGSGCIVKNRYPIEAQHGYEGYSVHACYNMLACSMLCAAWLYADDSIAERPAPADLGGFVIPIPEFNMIVANAGGSYSQYMTLGNHKYNPTGLIRIHLRGGHPQLGPSDGCAALISGKEADYAVGPAWKTAAGDECRLAQYPGVTKSASAVPLRFELIEEKASEVRFRISGDWENVKLQETITLNAEGVQVEDLLSGADSMRLYFPALISNGAQESVLKLAGAGVTLELEGRGVRFQIDQPSGVSLQRSGKQLKHRNGMMEPLVADIPAAKASYSIRAASH